jgi:outer membrane protein
MLDIKRKLGVALAALMAVATLGAPASLAADVTDIGFVDQAALSSLPSFQNAAKQLAAYKAQLDKQFAQRLKGVHDQNVQARIAQEFQNKFGAKQQELMAPLFARAQVAIASVASSRNLSVIVDKRIIIVGGQDVTSAVADLLMGPGDPIPPVNTPPPSTVGFVDQTQIDAVPKLKAANDAFQKFQADQQQQVQTKMKAAKTDADRQQILKDAEAALEAKKKDLIDPLVDQTRNAIASVAKTKGLLLVIDRTNLIFGGTDITSDVTNQLK